MECQLILLDKLHASEVLLVQHVAMRYVKDKVCGLTKVIDSPHEVVGARMLQVKQLVSKEDGILVAHAL